MTWSERRRRDYPTLRERPDRFWAKVDTTGDGCWPWLGCLSTAGYGRAGKRGYAHRLAYEFAYGPIPAGLEIRHACDNPPCCNPAHLLVGTREDNAHDMVVRGRHYSPWTHDERIRHGFELGGPCR
jgi:hypothetical protein